MWRNISSIDISCTQQRDLFHSYDIDGTISAACQPHFLPTRNQTKIIATCVMIPYENEQERS